MPRDHNCHPDLIIFAAQIRSTEIGQVRSNLQSSEHTADIPLMTLDEVEHDGSQGLLAEVEQYLA
jgi:hypothetical protein